MIFPWQTSQWEQLWRAKKEGRLPHALLFAGIPGTGKAPLAENFARAILCQQLKDTQPCGSCHACRLMTGRAHPNMLWLEPEKPRQAIKVDQVREVSEFINHSSIQGDYRIVIINPADNMNASAANALLKTLEEPSSGSLLILVSDQPSRLPATILSRCQRITFQRPATQLALNWLTPQLSDSPIAPELLLRLANGAPLSALRLKEEDTLTMRQDLFTILYQLSQKQTDPIRAAANLPEFELIPLLDFILTWTMDLLRLQLGDDAASLINQDYIEQLNALKQQTNLKTNTHFMEYLHQVRSQLCRGLNLNKQLIAENILIRWRQCGEGACF